MTQPMIDDPHVAVDAAEALFRASEHEAAFGLLSALDLVTLPAPLLDRALPVLLMAGEATAGEAQTLALLDSIELRIPDEPREAAAIVMTYRAEATLDPRTRAEIASAALAELPPTVAPTARHRALGVVVAAKVDLGEGLDEGILEQMKELERLIELVAPVDSAEAQRGFLAYQVGHLDESRTSLRLMRDQAAQAGQPFMERIFALHLATVDMFAGRLGAAKALLAECTVSTLESQLASPSMASALGQLALREGDDRSLQSVLLQPTLHGSEVRGGFVRKALIGLAAARREDFQEAHRQLTQALTRAAGLGLDEPGRRMWIDFDLARAAVAVGEIEEASAIADRLDRMSAGGRPLLDGVVARIRGLVAQSENSPRSIALLEESVAVLAGAGFPDQLALSLLELGRALTAGARLDDARKVLERARVLADQTEERAILFLIEHALSFSSSDALLSSLTPRERQIARAAARGASSRDIAASDFTSARTVETQLSSIYRKLGLRSRAQLTALLADEVRDEVLQQFT
jgi:DNA-binding CsgD family transcriptional regulator